MDGRYQHVTFCDVKILRQLLQNTVSLTQKARDAVVSKSARFACNTNSYYNTILWRVYVSGTMVFYNIVCTRFFTIQTDIVSWVLPTLNFLVVRMTSKFLAGKHLIDRISWKNEKRNENGISRFEAYFFDSNKYETCFMFI